MEQDTNRNQTHVHEIDGSTFIAEQEPHNHRFSGVTSEVIPYGDDSHVHEILITTDFCTDHSHEVGIRTGPAIIVGSHKHIHFVYGKTTVEDKHYHKYVFVTQIQDPLVWDD
ncbi:MAG: hypothetical protein H6Q68_2681 [Firmicutes bacterium]|nr:hypothetical protein [Bacillota bacterium]